jgi:lipoyl-dependent peroxiredoxin
MASIVRNATAVWVGAGKDGRGTLTTQSGTLDEAPYSFAKRFGEEKGTNPEELIAAAHAGCFSMALAFQLSGAGHVPDQLQTKADLSIVQEGGGWRIDAITLNLKAKIPGIDREEFLRLADTAKANCPVSRVLNAQISLKAKLE